MSHSLGGVILCIFSLLDAVSLYHRDIFSVAKDKNHSDVPEAALATIYAHARFQIGFGIITLFVSNSVLYLF